MFKTSIVITFLLLIVPSFTHAEIEWTLKKQLKTEGVPLDSVLSPDGQKAYILTSGKITVYSLNKDKVLSRIPVDKTFDRISAQTNTLMVSSSKAKIIRIIQLKELHKFDLNGLAFKGSQKAPVTIAVFSDYQ